MMTRRWVAAVFLFALATGACKRSAKHGTSELLSVVSMDDPRADSQLLQGVHMLEEGKWRWTARQFSVILRPPAGSAQDGARMELMLNIPDVVVKELGAVTLSATAGSSTLAPEKYATTGAYVYTRDVPGSALGGDNVTIDFTLDKAIPAGQIERRELGLIVTSVGLASKSSK
jgi:hypothetical protein